MNLIRDKVHPYDGMNLIMEDPYDGLDKHKESPYDGINLMNPNTCSSSRGGVYDISKGSSKNNCVIYKNKVGSKSNNNINKYSSKKKDINISNSKHSNNTNSNN